MLKVNAPLNISTKLISLFGKENLEKQKNFLMATNSKSACYKFPHANSHLFVKIEEIPSKYNILNYKEINKLKNLQSENVLNYIEVFTQRSGSQKQLVTVTDFVNCANIFDAIKLLKPTPDKLINLLTEILSGFRDIHHIGLLHRDINFNNLVLANSPDKVFPKIIDFNFLVPRTDCLFVSPEFLAPEVTSYETYSKSSEIWAIGILIYVLLSNRFPFPSRLDGLEPNQVLENTRKEIDFYTHRFPYPYKIVLDNLLCHRPDERVSDLGDVIDLLGKNVR